MYRLLLISFCHLVIYFNYWICDLLHPGNDKDSVNLFDLKKHIGYYLIAAALVIMDGLKKDIRFESHVIFLKVTLIWGVLLNCILFNLDKDRAFHWYSILLVLLSIGGAIKQAYPSKHEYLITHIHGYKYFFIWSKS